MKLNIVPARTGIQWMREGIRTFFKQPLALAGLFSLYCAVFWIAGMIPVVGHAAVVLVPGFQLGLMAATKQASDGGFPMPHVFLSAFRTGRAQLRAMLMLGALFALAFWIAMSPLLLLDPATLPQVREGTPIATPDAATQFALLLCMALQLLVAMLFWHAPALVHWHGITPAKSVFFSLVACLRNFWAFMLFGIAWSGVVLGLLLASSLVAVMLGASQHVAQLFLPIMTLLAAMITASTYFTFRDCFIDGERPIS